MARKRTAGARAAALLGAVALAAAAGCVREVVAPVRETQYVTTRSGEDVTMTWTGRKGVYYSVFYSDRATADAQWKLHPAALNLRAAFDGEQMSITDRVPMGRDRRYRLVQDAKPLQPTRR